MQARSAVNRHRKRKRKNNNKNKAKAELRYRENVKTITRKTLKLIAGTHTVRSKDELAMDKGSKPTKTQGRRGNETQVRQ